MTDSTGEKWFKIVTAVSAGFFAGFSVANAIYYNNIRTRSCNAVSKGEATTMLWVNIILAILSIIIFFWALYLLIFSSEIRTDLNNQPTQFINQQPTMSSRGQVVTPVSSSPAQSDIYGSPVSQAPLPSSALVSTSGSFSANSLPASALSNQNY